jgi:hypothetical protein
LEKIEDCFEMSWQALSVGGTCNGA